MKKILVSACLLGVNCRYNGVPKGREQVQKLLERKDLILIPVCPEQLGGLSTPRDSSEVQRDGSVCMKSGRDVTEQYERGAREALRLYRLYACEAAILKERSPSCGKGRIYDGSFSGKLIDGDGITAGLFQKEGIRVLGESELDFL